MDVLSRVAGRTIDAVARVIEWSLSPVEEEHAANVIPLPGPAHGPVPAIELRVDTRRRKPV